MSVTGNCMWEFVSGPSQRGVLNNNNNHQPTTTTCNGCSTGWGPGFVRNNNKCTTNNWNQGTNNQQQRCLHHREQPWVRVVNVRNRVNHVHRATGVVRLNGVTSSCRVGVQINNRLACN